MNALNLSIGVPEEMERLGWVLVHFVWQGALVGILTWIGLALRKKSSAQSRYLFLCGALLSCLLFPCVTWTLLDKHTQHPLGVTTDRGLGSFDPHLATTPLITTTTGVVPFTPEVKKVSLFQDFSLEQIERSIKAALPSLVVVWSLGVIFLSLRLLHGWLQLRHLCASGIPVRDRIWVERLDELSQRLGIRRTVCLLESILIEVPAVIGWLRPVILVPATFLTGLPADQIEAILAHELAHIRRHDYFANLIQIAVETLLFYHPVVWWISRAIREERENCCDDLALGIVGDKAIYVTALASLEESRSLPMAITMSAAGGSLLQRIRRILGAEKRKDSSWLVVITILVVAAIVGSVFGETKQHAKAEKKPASAKVPMQVEIETRYLVVPQRGLEKLRLEKQVIDWLNVSAPIVDPRILALAGVYTDTEFQSVLHALSQQPGADLLSAPKVTVTSGRKASIEVHQPKNSYPAASQNQSGGTNQAASAFKPLIPRGPFEGVQLDAEPTVCVYQQAIDLRLCPQVTIHGNSIGVDTEITVYDGQTVVFEASTPGDEQKHLFVFVTVRLVDPTGAPLNKPAYTLNVTCVDQSGTPLAGASVKAEWPDHSTNLTTDSNGMASIALPATRPPYLSARVRKEGFVPKIINWTLKQPDSNLPSEYTLNMEKVQSIGGFVKNEDGQSVENAKVVLIIRGSSMGGEEEVHNDIWERRVTTDKEGKWHFDEAPSDLHSLSVTLEHPDYISNERIDPRPADDDFKQQKAVLIAHNGVPVDGTVTDEKGNPIEGVDVTYGEAGSETRSYPQAKTDSKGHYKFGGFSIKKSYLAPILTFTSNDHAPVMVELPSLTPSKPINVVMKTGKLLRVRFIDQQGNAIKKVTLDADTWKGHRPFKCLSFSSDTNGVVIWDHAPESPITYAVDTDGFQYQSPIFEPKDEVQTYQLNHPTVVTGRVIDAVTKKPITDYKLIPGRGYTGTSYDLSWDRGSATHLLTDTYRYIFDRPVQNRLSTPPVDGFHRILIEAPGYELGVSRPIRNDEETVSIDFELKPALTIPGTVTAADGSVVKNAQIIFVSHAVNAMTITGGIYKNDGRLEILTANDRGEYALPPEDENYPIAIIQPDAGYLTTSYNALKSAPNVRLLPWGQIHLTSADTNPVVPTTGDVKAFIGDQPKFDFRAGEPEKQADGTLLYRHLAKGPIWLGVRSGTYPGPQIHKGMVVNVENGETAEANWQVDKLESYEPGKKPMSDELLKKLIHQDKERVKDPRSTNSESKSPEAISANTPTHPVQDTNDSTLTAATNKTMAAQTPGKSGSETQEKLTPERVAALTAPVKVDPKERILVEISGVGKAELNTSSKEDVTMGHSDDFLYPKRFDPPQKLTSTNSPIVTPSFPKDFKNEKLGLKIQLHAERVGSVIALYGVVERTQFMGFIDNTTGELQGPVVDKHTGVILTTNTINQPMFQKDISSFYLTAIPGKSYEVPFFQGKNHTGKKAETHTIKVTLQ